MSRPVILPPPPPVSPNDKEGLHPRNRHRGRYDFPALIAALPELAPFVAVNAHGDQGIDFGDPLAVRALNHALLKAVYRIDHWHLPEGYLCPPIPGRADYLHYAADLLAEHRAASIPRGPKVRVLDVGVGANCIYPLLGYREYGWSFVGSEVDVRALAAAQRNVVDNRGLSAVIECRRQLDAQRCFAGVVDADELFDLVVCNPPFHGSLVEAHAGTTRKLRNLEEAAAGKRSGRRVRKLAREAAAEVVAPVLNFGGQESELWCPGGEAAFVGRMIAESAQLATRCRWFTALIAKEENLPSVKSTLKTVKPRDSRVIDMAQGQKHSRLVAWTFLTPEQHGAWRSVAG